MKNKFIATFYCILQAVVGILILVNPVMFTSGILKAIGVFLCITGIAGVLQYFRTPIEAASKGQLLTKGLLTMLIGLFGLFGSNWLIATFPIITVIYGILMLVIGISKIQFVADAIRKKEKRWYLGIISAVITLACAGVVIQNPFTSTAVLWMFTGVLIIVDAVFDLIALFFMKEHSKEKEDF